MTTVAVGSVHARDRDGERVARHYRRSLVDHLRDSDAFERVLAPPPRRLPADAVLVTGEVLDVETGNEALRLIVGYGVGGYGLRVRFRIQDPTGRTLAVFEQDGDSYDGGGYEAHTEPLYLEDYGDELARSTARAIVRWSRGEGLEPGWLDVLDPGWFEF